MKDILPDESWRWQRLEMEFRRVVAGYGYAEVRTPLIEATELFVREIGADTDVVEKEMYSFERHGDALTVRPDGTAGVARAYVQHTVRAR
jgi:histidyl-tRNA synthetase